MKRLKSVVVWIHKFKNIEREIEREEFYDFV